MKKRYEVQWCAFVGDAALAEEWCPAEKFWFYSGARKHVADKVSRAGWPRKWRIVHTNTGLVLLVLERLRHE